MLSQRLATPMSEPGLNPAPVQESPLFVTMGFDDNGCSGHLNKNEREGVLWASEFFASLRNPPGSGNTATFDGTNGTCSFYCASKYIRNQFIEPIDLVKKSWCDAYELGHEIGNHTRQHLRGADFEREDWIEEIVACSKDLMELLNTLKIEKKYGEIRNIVGFRAPFLQVNSHTFQALRNLGFSYDCSIEVGGPGEDGTNYRWPYLIPYSASHTSDVNQVNRSETNFTHSLWEIPNYRFICPNDQVCEQYGIESGLRKRLQERHGNVDIETSTITGFDYNCLVLFKMTASEWLATLKYSLDLRIQGNRAPFTIGAHAAVYSRAFECPNISAPERRWVVESFFHYAITKPMVRVVSADKILNWMKNPVSI